MTIFGGARVGDRVIVFLDKAARGDEPIFEGRISFLNIWFDRDQSGERMVIQHTVEISPQQKAPQVDPSRFSKLTQKQVAKVDRTVREAFKKANEKLLGPLPKKRKRK